MWVRIPPGVLVIRRRTRPRFAGPDAWATLGRRGPGTSTVRPRDPGGTLTARSRDAEKVRERLTDVQERLRRARANLRVLEEQVAYLGELADEAETRKLVSGTPLADRDWQRARTDHERHARLRDETRDEIDELELERDRLLDRLLEVEGTR